MGGVARMDPLEPPMNQYTRLIILTHITSHLHYFHPLLGVQDVELKQIHSLQFLGCFRPHIVTIWNIFSEKYEDVLE